MMQGTIGKARRWLAALAAAAILFAQVPTSVLAAQEMPQEPCEAVTDEQTGELDELLPVAVEETEPQADEPEVAEEPEGEAAEVPEEDDEVAGEELEAAMPVPEDEGEEPPVEQTEGPEEAFEEELALVTEEEGQREEEAALAEAATAVVPIAPASVLVGTATVQSLFPDAVFAGYIAAQLGKSVGDTVTQNELNTIRTVNPSGAVHDVEGIQYLNGAREVRLDNLQITQRLPDAFMTDIYPNLSFYIANNQRFEHDTVHLDNPTLQQVKDQIPPIFTQIAENSGGRVVGQWVIMDGFGGTIETIPAVNGNELLQFAGVDSGSYRIELQLYGGVWMGFDQSIWIWPIVFDGQRQGSLSGHVTNENGVAMVGVTITLNDGSTTTTDQNGYYAFAALDTGSYTVTASADDYNSQTKSTTITAGQESVVDFRMVPNSGSVRVIVLDAATQQPIAGANVELLNLSSNVTSYSGTTGADGTVRFDAVITGIYAAIGSAEDYSTERSTANGVGNNQTTEYTVLLNRLTYTLTGTVYDAQTGLPIEGATVTLSAGQTETTDSEGRYSFTDILLGSYTVTGSAQGYSTEQEGVTLPPDGVADLYLHQQPVTIRVHTYVDTEQAGNELAAVGLTLTGMTDNGRPISQLVSTGADGTYTFQLMPGSYELSVGRSGYRVISPDQMPYDFTVEVGQDGDLVFILELITVAVSGIVYDVPNETAFPGAVVTLRGPDGDRTVTVGADGAYRFDNVPIGDYTVTAVPPAGSEEYLEDSAAVEVDGTEDVTQNLYLRLRTALLNVEVRYYNTGGLVEGATVTVVNGPSSVTDASGDIQFRLPAGTWTVSASLAGYEATAQTVTLEESGEETLVFYLHLPPALVGHVLDALTRVPVEGATVSITSDSALTDAVYETTTDVAGFYSFQDIEPGTYEVEVTKEGYQGVTRPGVLVVLDEVTTENFALVPLLGSLTGTVMYANGSPVMGAVVELSDGETTVTDENGHYAFILKVGDYAVSETTSNYGTQTKGAEVVPQRTTVVDFILPDLPGTLEGTVTDESGLPVAGVAITAYIPGTTYRYETVTDANGFYRFPEVMPGAYTVVSAAEGYGTQARRGTVESEMTTVVDFILGADPGVLRGTVTWADSGEPVEGALIGILPDGIELHTDGDGTYTIPLVAGVYTVTMEYEIYSQQATGVRLLPDRETVVNFAIDGPGVLEGYVTRSDTGAAMAGVQIMAAPGGYTTITDETGYYRMELPFGSYTVTADPEGFAAKSQVVLILIGQVSRADFAFALGDEGDGGTPGEGGGTGGDGGTGAEADGATTAAGGVNTGDGGRLPFDLMAVMALALSGTLYLRRRWRPDDRG